MYQDLPLSLLKVLLLMWGNIIGLDGNPNTGHHGLHCVNDYLFTINCTLTITPSQKATDSFVSYWLTLTDHETFVCLLSNIKENFSCSVRTSVDNNGKIFSDTDTFKISLCSNQTDGSQNCDILDDRYKPHTKIKPNTPCCLTVSHFNSSQYHFTWESTYEKYDFYTDLVDSFEFQLHIFQRGPEDRDDNGIVPRTITTNSIKYSVDDQIFAPETEYSARVRSCPDMTHYKGQWSDWSAEVHWTTQPVVTNFPKNTFIPELLWKVLTLVFVMVLLILLIYIPVKKWRQGALIPTPESYFRKLYNDGQGDFKIWVMAQENEADIFQGEASLQIDTVIKCEDSQHHVHNHQMTEDHVYENTIDLGQSDHGSPVLLSSPYNAGTALEPLSAPEGLTCSQEPRSPAEGDSGCWLSSDRSLEKDCVWFCKEYCTLTAFEQTCPFTAEDPQSQACKNFTEVHNKINSPFLKAISGQV